MKVQVLPRHIAYGEPCIEEHCPIALAVMDALAGEPITGVFVGCDCVTVCYRDGTEKRWDLPWEITEVIDEYDATKVMYPFGFELPEEHARLGADLGVVPGDLYSPAWDGAAAEADLGDDRGGSAAEESGEMVALYLELVP